MTTQVTGITANLSIETAAFIRDMAKASQAVATSTSQMQRSLNGIQKGFSDAAGFVKGFVGAAVSAAGVRALVQLAENAVRAGDEVGEAATKLGIGAESLQRFRFAAAQADVDTGSLDEALKKFQSSLAGGKVGYKDFQTFIEAIANAPSHIEKVRIAQEALGKQFQTGLLLAAQGAEEFRKQADSAFVLSDRAVSAAGTLDNQIRAIQNSIVSGFQTGFLEGFTDEVGNSRDAIVELNRVSVAAGSALSAIFVAALKAIVPVRDAIRDINEFGKPLANVLDTITGAGNNISPATQEVLDFFGAVRTDRGAFDTLRAQTRATGDDIRQFVTDTLVPSGMAVGDFFKQIATGDFSPLVSGLDMAGASFQNFISKISFGWTDNLIGATKIVYELYRSAASLDSLSFETFKSNIASVGASISDFLNSLTGGAFDSFIDGISRAGASVSTFVSDHIDAAATAIGNFFSSLDPTGKAGAFIDALASWGASIDTFVRDHISAAINALKDFITWATNAAGLGQTVASGIAPATAAFDALATSTTSSVDALMAYAGAINALPKAPTTLAGPSAATDLMSQGINGVDFEKMAKDQADALAALQDQIGPWKTTVEKASADGSKAIKGMGDTFQRTLTSSVSNLQGFTGALASESKEWFRINQAASIAQALIATYTGAAEALKLGPILGPIMAAAQVAAGLAYVAQIAATNPNSKSGSAKGSAAFSAKGASAASASAGSSSTSSGSKRTPQQTVNITVQGEGGFSSDQVRELIGHINDAVGDGVQLRIR